MTQTIFLAITILGTIANALSFVILRRREKAFELRKQYIYQMLGSPIGSLSRLRAVIDAEKPAVLTRREVLQQLLDAEP